MVVFQNKIIFMPFLPPYARKERISDYFSHGIKWREVHVQAEGAKISLCIADTDVDNSTTVYILYFHGNAGSIPMRLPSLSPVVKSLMEKAGGVGYTVVCMSYRGYWTSQNKRPSESGLAKDSAAALRWIESNNMSRRRQSRIPIILWGQSLGCGVASNLAASSLTSKQLDLRALILETPFLSIKDMLAALYPQKWLPYRYIYPFLWNRFDTCHAIAELAKHHRPDVLILQAEKDELVPREHGEVLEKLCRDVDLPVVRRVIRNCLHTDVMLRAEGRLAVIEAIRKYS